MLVTFLCICLFLVIHLLDLTQNMNQGAIALASLLTNPQCCLKVLVMSKCRLGLHGILRVLEALSENCCLEELHLAGNICPEENCTYHMMPVKETSDLKDTSLNFPDSSVNMSASKEGVASPQEVCPVNADYNQLEVADSDDDTAGKTAATSENLLAAVKMATQLQMLNLSNNGFCQDVAEKLYAAWSSSRAGLAKSHILDKVIHLSRQGKKCCGSKPCCRRI